MHWHGKPLLDNLCVFQSRDRDETQAWLQKVDFRVDYPVRAASQLDTRLNGIYLPGMYLGYAQYGSAVLVRASPARNDYWVQLPLRGHLEATVGRNCIDCNPDCAWIASPTRQDYYTMRSDADSARIHMCLNKSALTHQLEMLLNDSLGAPLELAPTMSLTNGYGNSLARFAWMVTNDLDRAGSIYFAPAAMIMLEQFIFTALLMSHPHNYSAALQRLERPIAPRDVKRAIDYIHAHVDAPITLADIVRASGVPGRTLFKHFNDCRGQSPMRYLRNVRLDKARETLRRADPGATVTDIATQWGFTHMGRFSVEYRLRFGESPSETLSRNFASSPSRAPSRAARSFSDFRAAWWKGRHSD
jgi:AraC-like DNA-binding protein